MKKLILAALLLASCSKTDDEARRQERGKPNSPVAQSQSGEAPAGQSGRIGSLVGLYEGGGEPRNQMCVVEGKGGGQRFGLIIWGSNQHSCMGSGAITRDGEKVRLVMAGDSACTIEATISGNSIKLPSAVPQGCSYYCGARASLGGAVLAQAATTKQAAMRANDIVGESLCSGEGG